MQKSISILLSLLCCTALFTACSNDDDKSLYAEYSTSSKTNPLQISYSGQPMLGKKAQFTSTDGKTATIVFTGDVDVVTLATYFSSKLSKAGADDYYAPGIIPGELSTTLTNVPLSMSTDGSYVFSGTYTSSTGATATYKGNVTSSIMAISFDVTMPANSMLGTWKPVPMTASTSPFYGKWTSSAGFKINLGSGDINMPAQSVLTLTGAAEIAPKILSTIQQISLLKDGNITGKVVVTNSDGTSSVQTLPLNLLQYYVKDNTVYLLLNLDMLMAVESTKALSVTQIVELIKTLSPYYIYGIPLSVSVTNAGVAIYADTEVMTKLLGIVIQLLSDPDYSAKLMAKIAADPQMSAYSSMVTSMISQLPAVLAGTTKLQAGLVLMK